MPCGLGLSIVYSGGWVSKAYTVYTRTNKHTTVCTVPKTVWISTLEPILLYIRLEQIQRYAMQRYNMQRYTMQRYTELCNGILCNGLQCNGFCKKYFTISKTHTVVLHPLDSRKRLVFFIQIFREYAWHSVAESKRSHSCGLFKSWSVLSEKYFSLGNESKISLKV